MGAADSQAAEMIEEATALLSTRQYTKAKMIAYWAIRQAEYAVNVSSGEAVVEEDKAAMAESLIAAAEEARKKAASVGGEWRDTARMIKSAQTLAGAGEFDQAIEAASAAKFQADRGYEQAMAEKDSPEWGMSTMVSQTLKSTRKGSESNPLLMPLSVAA